MCKGSGESDKRKQCAQEKNLLAEQVTGLPMSRCGGQWDLSIGAEAIIDI